MSPNLLSRSLSLFLSPSLLLSPLSLLSLSLYFCISFCIRFFLHIRKLWYSKSESVKWDSLSLPLSQLLVPSSFLSLSTRVLRDRFHMCVCVCAFVCVRVKCVWLCVWLCVGGGGKEVWVWEDGGEVGSGVWVWRSGGWGVGGVNQGKCPTGAGPLLPGLSWQYPCCHGEPADEGSCSPVSLSSLTEERQDRDTPWNVSPPG